MKYNEPHGALALNAAGAFESLPRCRKDAVRLGVHRYFTGKACVRGHLAPRYIAGACVQCQLEHCRRYGGWKARPSRQNYLDKARTMVEQRGGILLSTEYRSAKSSLRVRCAEGHEFGTHYDRLSHGGWCRKCWKQKNGVRQLATKGRSPEELRKFALSVHGGDCLSTARVSVHTNVLWRCANPKHSPFLASINKVLKSGQWCPTCWAERRQPPQPPMPKERVESVVRSRGGQIAGVVGEWKGGRTRLKIRCANAHEWQVAASSLVFAKSWCPECLYAGERIVRAIFEETFDLAFPKVRPAWMPSPKGRRLELDGYNKVLAIAFEYQGPHHDVDSEVRRHDALKRLYCREQEVLLIEIPFIRKPRPPENVLTQVQVAFRIVGRPEKPRLPAREIFANELAELQTLARERGGTLLSTRYLGEVSRVEWKCAISEHPGWRAAPNRIRKGAWCRYCAKRGPLNVGVLGAWGKKHGLELMDDTYSGVDKAYRWRCVRVGHVVRRSKANISHSVVNGLSACPKCAGTNRNVTLLDVRACVSDRGWTVRSDHYKNALAPLRFVCGHGHPFTRNWNAVQQGRGCTEPGCPDNRVLGRWRRHGSFGDPTDGVRDRS